MDAARGGESSEGRRYARKHIPLGQRVGSDDCRVAGMRLNVSLVEKAEEEAREETHRSDGRSLSWRASVIRVERERASEREPNASEQRRYSE